MALALITLRLSWSLLKQAMNTTANCRIRAVHPGRRDRFTLTFRAVNGDLWVEHLSPAMTGGEIGS